MGDLINQLDGTAPNGLHPILLLRPKPLAGPCGDGGACVPTEEATWLNNKDQAAFSAWNVSIVGARSGSATRRDTLSALSALVSRVLKSKRAPLSVLRQETPRTPLGGLAAASLFAALRPRMRLRLRSLRHAGLAKGMDGLSAVRTAERSPLRIDP